MSGIIFGDGMFIRALDGDTELRIDDGIPNFTEEAGDTAAPAVRMLADTAAELTVTLNKAQFEHFMWWMRFGRPCFFSVSNNRLRMRGYPTRRRVQVQRAARLYHHCGFSMQVNCDSFECLYGCHFPVFHGAECDHECAHYGKCESCTYWWLEHKGWRSPLHQ